MALKEIGLQYTSSGFDTFIGDAQKADSAIQKMAGGMESAGKEVNSFSQVTTGALRKIGELAVDAALQAGQAIVGFVGESISAAGDYEAGMNRFAAVTGSALAESGQSLQDFSNLFLKMGAETQFSASQAQDAAINLAKGGLDPAAIAAGGLKAAMDLAAAGELDLAQAAEITAKQYGVWVSAAASAAEKAQFLAQSADLLSQAANASTVGVADLAMGMANVGGVAKVAGLSFQETVQTMALIAPGFSSAADAGTSFKTFLSRLIPSTDSAAAAMQRLGLLTADGSSKFYDSQGAFIGMDKAAQLLQGSLEGLSEAERITALQTIFGADAIRAATAIAEAGSAGFQQMGVSMAAAGTAAEQAAARNKGFNFAVESLLGSLDTLKIVLGSALLPALTNIINGGLIPVVNAATALAGNLDQVGSTIMSVAVPALAGLTAAAIAYGVVNASTLIPQAGVLIGLLISQAVSAIAAAGGMAALAVSTLAVVAPIAVFAAAVAGAVAIGQQLTSGIADQATQLLNTRQWWLDSSAALEVYKQSEATATPLIQARAQALTALRTEQQADIEDLARRMALGEVSDAQYQQEMATINARAQAITGATTALNADMAAQLQANAASMTATATLAALGEQHAVFDGQVQLSAEKLEELGKQLEETYQKGAEAVGNYVQTEAAFLSDSQSRRDTYLAEVEALTAERETAMTDEQKSQIDQRIADVDRQFRETEATAAASYSQQQAAQRSHLGMMLIEYTNAQAAMGNITKEKAAEMTAALAEQFGIQRDNAAVTFAAMAAEIDKFASDANASASSATAAIAKIGDEAVETEQKATEMAKQYVMEQVNNFAAGKSDASSYADALNSIPKRVETTVHTKYTSEGDVEKKAKAPGGSRAVGGPVQSGVTYLVGEKGPELLVPETDGHILTADQTKRLLRGGGVPGELSGMGQRVEAAPTTSQASSASYSSSSVVQNYNLSLLTAQPVANVQQGFAVMKALASAGV